MYCLRQIFDFIVVVVKMEKLNIAKLAKNVLKTSLNSCVSLGNFLKWKKICKNFDIIWNLGAKSGQVRLSDLFGLGTKHFVAWLLLQQTDIEWHPQYQSMCERQVCSIHEYSSLRIESHCDQSNKHMLIFCLHHLLRDINHKATYIKVK